MLLMLQNTFQRRDTQSSSRSSSMELPDDIPHRAPARHSTDMRHSTSSRHSVDLSRAHSVRPPGAAAGQASQLARGSTSHSDNSAWDNVSEENKGIIRQVTQLHPHAPQPSAHRSCITPLPAANHALCSHLTQHVDICLPRHDVMHHAAKV